MSAPPSEPVAPDDSGSRRSFLDYLLLGGAAVWALALSWSVWRGTRPRTPPPAARSLQLRESQVAELERARHVTVESASGRLLVVRDLGGRLHALGARCTHRGCIVRYAESDDTVWCACHRGRYSVEGRVLEGPPPRPLPVYPITVAPDGAITVDLETA